MKEYMKKYTAEHKDRKKVLDREYFLKNKEKIMAYYSEYRNTESGKLRKKVYKHKRRVQIKQTDDGTVTKESLQELIVSQDYLCKFC
jgi:glucan-binding YG repeat protein